MEGNVCDVNHLDSDVLLPPRKRLLACLKRQNSDVNGNSNSNSPSSCTSLDQLDARISYLLKAHLSNDNPSQEEIVTASRAAAEAAVKVALAARAAAKDKAVIAAKAMAAAKKALELVATFGDDQGILSELELNRKKTNDEELARKLHQAINSSPRITQSGDVKNHKHKKLKTLQAENNGTKAKCGDDDVTRKRGRMKQKKLPLSICHYRDQATPKEDVTASERGPLWKCQAFKAPPACVKQTKVMQL